MGKKIVTIVLVLCIVSFASRAAAINLCVDGAINLDLAMSGSALIGTAGPMWCNGQSVFAMGSFTKVSNGFFFSIYFDQTPVAFTCTEGWDLVGLFKGKSGSGTWNNTPDFPDSGPFNISLGSCSPLKAGVAADPLAALPGMIP